MQRGRLVFLTAALLVVASLGEARVRVRVVHRGPRTRVVVHRGFPLRRTLPLAVVVTPRVAIRVAPVRYLSPLVWAPVIVTMPAHAALAWEDSEDLSRDDGWLDFTLTADARGRKLFLDVSGGSVRLNFAEVVFENGDAQVVDFAENVRPPGLYSLLDFADGRKVDHVRLVAQAQSDSAKIALRLLE